MDRLEARRARSRFRLTGDHDQTRPLNWPPQKSWWCMDARKTRRYEDNVLDILLENVNRL
jgi:hypothetical protein